MMKDYSCPVCGNEKIARFDTTRNTEGAFVWCKRHKGEVEVINRIKEPEPEPIVKNYFESQSQSQSSHAKA